METLGLLRLNAPLSTDIVKSKDILTQLSFQHMRLNKSLSNPFPLLSRGQRGILATTH